MSESGVRLVPIHTEGDKMDSLAQALEQLIPQSLDDIIRLNRDKAQLYLSKKDELDVLRGPVVLGMPKAHI